MVDGMYIAEYIGRILLVVAAVTTTGFPLLYFWSPWFKTRLGIAVMLQAVTLCFAVWLNVIITFFVHNIPLKLLMWVNVGVILLIVIATAGLTHLQWVYLRKAHKEGEDHE